MKKGEAKSKDPGFAERLRRLMTEKGVKNNNRLANSLGKASIVTLGWLKGKVPTQPADWKLLCEYFGVSADYLLLGKEEMAPDQKTSGSPDKPRDKRTILDADLGKILGPDWEQDEALALALQMLVVQLTNHIRRKEQANVVGKQELKGKTKNVQNIA